MGILLTFRSTADVDAQPRHEKLRKRGRILAAVFSGVFWFVALSVAALLLGALFYQGRHAAFGPQGAIVWTGPIEMQPGYRFMDEIEQERDEFV